MAIGIDRAVLLETDGGDWDPLATAGAIVEAIRALEADGEPFDLLLFGNEAADTGDFQVGIRVAVALGRPCVTGIKAIEAGRRAASSPGARRGGGWEMFELPLPAVLGGQGGAEPAALSVRSGAAPGEEEGDRADRRRSARPGRSDRRSGLRLPGGQREHGRGDRERRRRRRRPSSSCSTRLGVIGAMILVARRARRRPAGAPVARGAEPRPPPRRRDRRAGPRRPGRGRRRGTPPASSRAAASPSPTSSRAIVWRLRAGRLGGGDRPAHGGP